MKIWNKNKESLSLVLFHDQQYINLMEKRNYKKYVWYAIVCHGDQNGMISLKICMLCNYIPMMWYAN